MIVLLNSLLWLSCISGLSHDGPVLLKDSTDKKIECSELGLYFTLPAGFLSLDSAQLNKLGTRGQKAIKEEFDRETIKGWQPACMNFQDSFKRTILVTSITVKEAVEMSGSADKFIEQTFRDGNDFYAQRLNSRLGLEVNKKDAVEQNDITIAGMPVKKSAFTFIYGERALFFVRQYFFKKNDKLYFLTFTGSPKASDNEEIVKAIEAAKPLLK